VDFSAIVKQPAQLEVIEEVEEVESKEEEKEEVSEQSKVRESKYLTYSENSISH